MAQDPLYNCDDPSLLRKVASDLERRAQVYRDRAAEIEQVRACREQANTAVALAHATPQLVSSHLTAGMSLDQAMQAVSRETGMPLDTIRHHWRRWLNDRRAEQTAARHRLVVFYAGRGLTNAEIGQRLGLHPVSVSRILGRALRPAPSPTTAPAGGGRASLDRPPLSAGDPAHPEAPAGARLMAAE